MLLATNKTDSLCKLISRGKFFGPFDELTLPLMHLLFENLVAVKMIFKGCVTHKADFFIIFIGLN